MSKAVGIVLELQRNCLDDQVSVSAILRKAKVIASKLELNDLKQWITSELEGYDCSLDELPEYRKGIGQPKFRNPFHGWCPIMAGDDWFGEAVRTVFLKQSVSEMEELIAGDSSTLVMYYNPAIQEALQKQMAAPMECALHFSKSQVVSALEYVRNKTLDWTLELEGRGILGEDLSFGEAQKMEAQMVTNHIYGGNIGVLGNVSGDAINSRFINSSGVDRDALNNFLEQAAPALGGLDPDTRAKAEPLLDELKGEADGDGKPGRVSSLLGSLRNVLEGASGSLVASALLAALTG